MATVAKSRNLFGLFKAKPAYSPKLAKSAYAAGQKSGDTGEFEIWLRKQSKIAQGLRKSLESEYRRGVEAGEAKSAYPMHVWDVDGFKVWAEDPAKHGGRATWTTEADGRKKKFYRALDIDEFIAKRKKRNPCANTIKAGEVTDRAKRYRANQPGCQPAGDKCALCGSKSQLMVDHKDGNEANGARSNLRWLCRSCNVREGARMAREGKGVRTRQYNGRARNLTAKGGASNLAEYTLAGENHTRGAHDEGGKIIHNTPKSKRREFAAEIWRKRKAGADARYDDMPDWAKNPARRTATQQFRLVDGDMGDVVFEGTKAEVLAEAKRLRKIDPVYLIVEQLILSDDMFGEYWQRVKTIGESYYAENPRSRRNPASGAAEMYETFHGRPSEETLEIREEVHVHEHLAALGDLAYLKIKNPEAGFNQAVIQFNQGLDYNDRKAVRLCATEDGRQMYIRGGNQAVDLAALGMDTADWLRDSMVLGKITEVGYRTEKGFDKFKLTEYFHKAGEETTVRPFLIYDSRSKLLDVSGGQYRIEAAGIIN